MRMQGVAAGEHTPAASVPYHGFLDIMAGGERGCINRTHPQPVSHKKKEKKTRITKTQISQNGVGQTIQVSRSKEAGRAGPGQAGIGAWFRLWLWVRHNT